MNKYFKYVILANLAIALPVTAILMLYNAYLRNHVSPLTAMVEVIQFNHFWHFSALHGAYTVILMLSLKYKGRWRYPGLGMLFIGIASVDFLVAYPLFSSGYINPMVLSLLGLSFGAAAAVLILLFV